MGFLAWSMTKALLNIILAIKNKKNNVIQFPKKSMLSKGKLISKCPFGVIVLTKNPTNFF